MRCGIIDCLVEFVRERLRGIWVAREPAEEGEGFGAIYTRIGGGGSGRWGCDRRSVRTDLVQVVTINVWSSSVSWLTFIEYFSFGCASRDPSEDKYHGSDRHLYIAPVSSFSDDRRVLEKKCLWNWVLRSWEFHQSSTGVHQSLQSHCHITSLRNCGWSKCLIIKHNYGFNCNSIRWSSELLCVRWFEPASRTTAPKSKNLSGSTSNPRYDAQIRNRNVRTFLSTHWRPWRVLFFKTNVTWDESEACNALKLVTHLGC